jgi:probable HAF family extracellular repeat protein
VSEPSGYSGHPVTSWSTVANDPYNSLHAFLYSDGVMTNLGHGGGQDINDSG